MKNCCQSEVVLDALSVRYPSGVLALDQIEMRLGNGLFGLLGPNGAGKTTLMRTLATLQKPTSGRATIFGFDVEREPQEIRRLLGWLPQDFQTYPQLRVREVMEYYAILNRINPGFARRQRIDQLLDRVGLSQFRDRKAGQLSGGMLRRLGVAQALLADPRLLILDEPTAGLDPAERIIFRNFLGELSKDRVVILSTHIVSDISSSCDRLAVLDRGKVRFDGKRLDLIRQTAGKVWRITVREEDYEEIRRRFPVTGMVDTDEGLELRVLAADPGFERCQPAEASLEDAYLWLLGGIRRERLEPSLA